MSKRSSPWDDFFKLPAKHRLDRLLSRFETEEATLLEDATRIAGLNDAVALIESDAAFSDFRCDTDAMSDLSIRLSLANTDGVHIESLGSSFSMRNLRRSMFGAMSKLFEAYIDAELITFTILNHGWVLTPAQLRVITASTLREQLRRHLARAGVNLIAGPLVAFLHGEYDPIAGVFTLHFHGVTLLTKKAALLSMSGRWGYVKTASGADPIQCLPMADRVKQLSYLLKSYWPQRAVMIVDGRVERERVARRIGEPHHSLLLTWLDEHSPKDITLLMGCRWGSGGELVESDCSRGSP